MTRRNDWQQRLFAEIERHARQPFAYGVSDCWTLANGAVREITGKPLIAGIRYKSETGARRVLRKRGVDDVAGLVATVGLHEVAPVLAQRGDLGVTEGANGEPALVVNVGARWVGKTETGLMHIPRSRVVKAYRVA